MRMPLRYSGQTALVYESKESLCSKDELSCGRGEGFVAECVSFATDLMS